MPCHIPFNGLIWSSFFKIWDLFAYTYVYTERYGYKWHSPLVFILHSPLWNDHHDLILQYLMNESLIKPCIGNSRFYWRFSIYCFWNCFTRKMLLGGLWFTLMYSNGSFISCVVWWRGQLQRKIADIREKIDIFELVCYSGAFANIYFPKANFEVRTFCQIS